MQRARVQALVKELDATWHNWDLGAPGTALRRVLGIPGPLLSQDPPPEGAAGPWALVSSLPGVELASAGHGDTEGRGWSCQARRPGQRPPAPSLPGARRSWLQPSTYRVPLWGRELPSPRLFHPNEQRPPRPGAAENPGEIRKKTHKMEIQGNS